jgi:hypothetical protein
MYQSEQELYLDSLKPLLAHTDCLNAIMGVIDQLASSCQKNAQTAAELAVFQPDKRILAAISLGERNAYQEIYRLLTELRRV